MLEYERIDISEGIDVNKSDKLKKIKVKRIFTIIDILKILGSNINHIFAMVVII